VYDLALADRGNSQVAAVLTHSPDFNGNCDVYSR
jgi:hypothetical protein